MTPGARQFDGRRTSRGDGDDAASPSDPVVPAVVRARAAVAPGGRDWVERLPETVRALGRAWSLTVTDQLPGGTASVVTRAVTDGGRDVVVKVAAPGTGFSRQVRTLRAADGDGYVRVLAADAGREAVLLEALGTSLQDSGLPPVQQLTVLARLLRRAWRVPAPIHGPGPVDKAADLGDIVARLWEDLARPCDERVVELALVCARRRAAAFDPGGCVVVHGDAAAANAARVLEPRTGTEDGFVLLDPDGFVGDRAYDLGVALRDWCPELLASADPASLLARYCRAAAAQAGADAHAVWEWAYLERVSTGLHALSLGAEDAARALLPTAATVAPVTRAAGTHPPGGLR